MYYNPATALALSLPISSRGSHYLVKPSLGNGNIHITTRRGGGGRAMEKKNIDQMCVMCVLIKITAFQGEIYPLCVYNECNETL